jgi:hypothetical protein
MTLPDLLEADNTDLADPLTLLASACYQWGDCQVIRYDSTRTELFPGPSFLVDLYERCRTAGGGKLGPLGILPALFCSMKDLSCEAIVGYLQRCPVIVLGEWRARPCKHPERYSADDPRPTYFHSLGFAFVCADPIIAAPHLQPSNRNAIFAGYGFFDDAWRTPQQTVCMYLGIAFLLQEFRLAAIHGVRYADNHLTRRFASKFGFRDIGTIPNYLYRQSTGDLAAGTVSTLSRQDFSDLIRRVLISLRGETSES